MIGRARTDVTNSVSCLANSARQSSGGSYSNGILLNTFEDC